MLHAQEKILKAGGILWLAEIFYVFLFECLYP